jgi:uncharacterized protein (DUF58 family)
MQHEPRPPELARTFSVAGFAFMVFGLAIAAFELRYGLLLRRLGVGGRVVVLVCATGFSVWGLKELIANWWPSLGRRGFARHRAGWPVEGRVYLLITVVVFIGALIGRSNPLLLVFSMLAGPYVINAWISFLSLKGVSVVRSAPPRVMAGEPTSVELCLGNTKRWLSAWGIILRDTISDGNERLEAEVLVPRVPPRSERRANYRLRLMHRGRYQLGPLKINTRFPLGLVERGLTVAGTDTILVYPRIGRLTASWSQHLLLATELVPEMAPRSGPFNDEYHQLREYRLGDDPRAIHWPTSARRNELMVREFRESRDRHLVVLLDPWAPDRAAEPDLERVELAISLAATICAHHLRSSREAQVYFSAAAPRPVHWDSGRGGVESLLDELALLSPWSGNDWSPLLGALRAVRGLRARTLLISTRPESAAEWWARHQNHSSPEARAGGAEAVHVVGVDREQLARLVDWRGL